MSTIRLSVAQAVIRYLAHQYTERDGVEQRFIAGMFGIFGHGNVAGLGQALLQNEVAPDFDEPFDYWMGRNEQGMVHVAAAYAKQSERLRTLAVTSSIGPGALNMVTGAALATTNRVPVLLFPSDIFANRAPDPVLQQVEDPTNPDVSANDAFRPVSRFWDRVNRPEQLMVSLPRAMRVLTDPVETGAAVVCLPEDVQAEVYDWPVEFFAKKVWHIDRRVPDRAALARAVEAIRAAKKPLVIAGGGVKYSGASEELRAFATATGIPVADTQAGKGAINWDHERAVGGVGATGAGSANALADEADLIIGIGTRYSDFTTGSQTQFKNPDVRFVNINVGSFDAAKQGAEMLLADAREALVALTEALDGHRVDDDYSARIADERAAWARATDECYHRDQTPLPAQTEVFGALNEMMGDEDVVINAAGSMPGDLQCLWRARTPGQYHLEYAFSTMGYEIPAALGVKMASPDSEVVAIVGDGTYQMLPMELATIVQERAKVIFVLLQNYGFASIGGLSESRGSQRFGTKYRMRAEDGGRSDDLIPVDIAANARSWGIDVIEVSTMAEFREAYAAAVASDTATMIHIETDLYGPNPPATGWWDVPVTSVSTLESTQQAYREYAEAIKAQRRFF
ncbi:3D-(3,5/4)-trihydroxycyclohexane-1,2-dione acylhydrolase (decyclizing) [Tessaracoccus lapidicaptus]|uniref:3D-(3,5/4)-trihydroxycyclohexane-1,2-dione acylhydrolase (Decyclizing) n=1 Tax=Tessaracoccus lapidicaptus TaxID=1427523 RepID=A0A1C0AL98_9ACTN|nr:MULTISPECIES: 3D-(3,5/4)-trihydroxycyclohexane-1,2-dione acylhydrolase (decyclizing) [Tessaracoccus]AQX16104.1 3D-(3,5/4)-trihydroxycyclohexane-1,2-dione acylhydrolase (decyclizing) [Tessaracoccus sp. T2.5-30]OCL33406.1 3D-(3,5/4)-trihydroxycyclohexane-1,2-dione acylhydrolase (decyclizing) [Tessaracoccus lapidicaptus]VEP40650.1 3D-(3,5/4)-trihydroxycyclohexane-1,2-dione hydrolase [Tessaracoccus lapidicaptus]